MSLKDRLIGYAVLTGFLSLVVALVYHLVDKGAGLGLGFLLTIVGIPVFIFDALGYPRQPAGTDDEDIITDPLFAGVPDNIYHQK
jgi:hypothetical protein